MPQAAVLILNYNGLEHLRQFLPSVIEHSPGHRIIVADNGSTDLSIKFLEEQPVEIIRLDKNYGFTGGYNRAIEQVDSEHIVLLNSDVEVSRGWLDTLLEELLAHENTAAVQPKILSYSEKEKFEYAGAGGAYIDWLGYPFCRGRLFMDTETDTSQYDDSREVFWSSGACMLIKRSLYLKAGGLDNDFFAHMEEIDLCWRLLNMGHSIRYCGRSTVYHLGGGTLHRSNPKKTFLNFRNGLFMLIKNSKPLTLFYTLPLRWVLDIVAALKFSVFDHPADAWAVIRAHFSVLANIGSLAKKRRSIQNKGLPPEAFRRSIVLQHYLLRKKQYSDLPGIQ